MMPATPLARTHRPSPADAAPILGAITGHAQMVDEAIEAAAVSKLMRKLLHKAKRAAFSTAGFQQISRHPFMRAEPGIWCECHSAEWAHELGIRLPYLCELRSQAEQLGIWTYRPNPEAGSAWNEPDGYIRWNLNLQDWRPLAPEYRQARYSRAGAGRPPKEIAKEIDAPTADAAEESKVKRTAASPESKVKRGESKVKQTVIKSETAASFGAGNHAASPDAVRMGEETEETTTTANAGARARASEGTPKPEERPLIPWIARLHPDDQPEAWAIIETLQAIHDWPGRRTGKLNTAADAQAIHALVRDPADHRGHGIPMPWVAHQAELYALWGDEDHPVEHTRKGFTSWCLKPNAMADLARWLSNPWPLRVSPTTVSPTAAAAAPAANANRQGANTHGRRWSGARTDQRAGVNRASRAELANTDGDPAYEFN